MYVLINIIYLEDRDLVIKLWIFALRKVVQKINSSKTAPKKSQVSEIHLIKLKRTYFNIFLLRFRSILKGEMFNKIYYFFNFFPFFLNL